MKPEHRDNIRREIRNQRYLDHHHVMKLKDVIPCPPYLGMVMEYAKLGNLADYIRKRGGLTDAAARFFFQQIVLAVDYCHKMNVVNRDIKLENVLVTGNNEEWPLLKICDFGFSKNQNLDSVENTVVGTIHLIPPELLLLEEGDTYNGKQADVWCIGSCLYKMVTGMYPFLRHEDYKLTNMEALTEIATRIRSLKYEIPDDVEHDCADLIKSILVEDPTHRPTIEKIQSHEYFLKDLPPGANAMNQNSSPTPDFPTDEDIDSYLDLVQLAFP
eukprot:g88.t1